MTKTHHSNNWPQILLQCGDNGKRIHAMDWAATSLGPINDWPIELRLPLITCLQSRFPMGLNWGKDLIYLYNDAAKPVIGGKDEKKALGTPLKESFPEVWDIISPMFESVFNLGLSTWVEDQQVFLNRYGFTEECFMTWAYSPIRDTNGVIQGILTTVIETTTKVIGERRLKMLKEMASRTIGKSTIELACEESINVLKENKSDIPFAVIRLLDEEKNNAKVVSSFGIGVPDRGINETATNHHPALKTILKTKKPLFVEQVPVDVKLDGKTVQIPKTLYVLPLFNSLKNNDEIIGFLSVGLNPLRPFDDDYKNFLGVLSNQVSTSIMGARVQEKASREAFVRATEITRGELKRLGHLIDASPDHIFIFDKDGRYIYHNKATENALRANLINLGRGDEPTLNRNGFEMSFEPDFLKRFMHAKDEAFEGRVSMCPVTFPTLSGPRDFECILSPIYDETGVITSVAGITRDVTDLKQSIKVRDEFLSIASHELKTPLTTLKLQTQMRSRSLLKGKAEVFDEAKLNKMFHDDDLQINRLNRLVDDMLDASRLNAGKVEIHPEELDIKDVVTAVLDRLSLHLQNMNIQLSSKLESVRGSWDRYRIEQVFTNLVTNAIKYGEGKPIYVETALNNGLLHLIVKDQGMGIRAEDQKRIFKQFERAINSSSVSGLGLGLYIVKEILKPHGGKIKVESEFGKGSTFTITLPLIAKK